MAYSYLDASGLILPDTAGIKTEVEAEFKAVFGQDLVIDPESPEGLLIAAETEARDAAARNMAELANQINPGAAGGVFLDALCALTGLARRVAEPSMVKARLSGVPGTIIPAGARAATEAGDVFVSRVDLVLGGNGEGETWFYSEEENAVPCPVGSLTKMQDQLLGWEGITNDAPGALGRPVESDAELRKRRRDTLFLQGAALPGAILSAVLDAPGVRYAVLRENVTSETQIIDGAAIPPHSVYMIVDGGADEDVARAIFQKKSLGCGMKGDTEVSVICPESGQPYVIRFDRPELVAIRARVTVRVTGGLTTDYEAAVKRALMDYAEDMTPGRHGLTVGAAVSPFEMTAAVANQAEPSIFVLKLEIGLEAGAFSTDTMNMAIWQKATLAPERISVVTNA